MRSASQAQGNQPAGLDAPNPGGLSPTDLGDIRKWEARHTTPDLAGSEVHVWKLSLTGDCSFEDCLSPTEHAQIAKFRFEKDRLRAFRSQAFRRAVLGSYLGRDPRELQFATQENGKPILQSDTRGAELQFNISHSRDLLLLAVSAGPHIGIDVEAPRERVRFDDIARRFLPEAIATGIISARPEEKADQFFRAWTQVEAILKASGLGLAKGLGSVPIGQYAVCSFGPAPGYWGAIASSGSMERIRFLEWVPLKEQSMR